MKPPAYATYPTTAPATIRITNAARNPHFAQIPNQATSNNPTKITAPLFMPASITPMTNPEPHGGYLPDAWAAAHWLRSYLVEALPAQDEATTKAMEAHRAIVDHYIAANDRWSHYAGPEIIHALAGTIEALVYAYSDLPGYNPRWVFESPQP